jgi:phosphoribosyl 1,2-cyclic phosphate phosphodiesterase
MQPQRTFSFLGTGTSVGVPMLGCRCHVCSSKNPKNHRYRCSVLIETPRGNILIDTSPELRLQLLRQGAHVVHAVLYTHYHADHMFGLDDVRPLCKFLPGPLPLYCTDEVAEKIRVAYSYAFGPAANRLSVAYIPKLEIRTITTDPFVVLGEAVTPIPLIHDRFKVLGFRIANVAYCTDVSSIPQTSWRLLEGLDILVLDALRFKPHPAHFSINEAVDVIKRLKPAKAYLTHMSHDVEHEAVNRELPPGIELAYDGLQFQF